MHAKHLITKKLGLNKVLKNIQDLNEKTHWEDSSL